MAKQPNSRPNPKSLVKRGPGRNGPPKAGDPSPESFSQIETRFRRGLEIGGKKPKKGGAVTLKGKWVRQPSVFEGMPTNMKEFLAAVSWNRYEFFRLKVQSLKKRYHHKTAGLCLMLVSHIYSDLQGTYILGDASPEFGKEIVQLFDELLALYEKHPVKGAYRVGRLKRYRNQAQILVGHGIDELFRRQESESDSSPATSSKP